ncbi:hypothetical protein V6N12_062162 [Hibiscus sabdariffa]|uniref:Uncharacterized protein n=1 Tax=Hibiscus sabdariffa TaxID=183260 RepID=A0ABR2F811_9ROSI
MTFVSKTPVKVFFNNEIKKYDSVFASRPFIFEKSFDVKEESHLGFTHVFMSIVAMHKFSFSYDKDISVRLDVDYVNNMFNLSCEGDEHENFSSSLTTTKRNKILADLCEDGTQCCTQRQSIYQKSGFEESSLRVKPIFEGYLNADIP